MTAGAATTGAAGSAARPTGRSGCAKWWPSRSQCAVDWRCSTVFVIIGTIDVGDAIVATIGALVLAAIWLFSFWRRMKTNALVAQRPDRERRGF
jgi:hypothetical protein